MGRRDVHPMVLTVTEAIREAGRIPEGTLYATLMDRMGIEAFEKMVRIIVDTGLVAKRGHELVWVGPELKS